MNDPALTNLGGNEKAVSSAEGQGGVEPAGGEAGFSAAKADPPLFKQPPFALRWLSYLLLIPLVGAGHRRIWLCLPAMRPLG